MANLEFSVFGKNTSACRLEELGIELPAVKLVDDPFYLLSHSHPKSRHKVGLESCFSASDLLCTINPKIYEENTFLDNNLQSQPKHIFLSQQSVTTSVWTWFLFSFDDLKWILFLSQTVSLHPALCGDLPLLDGALYSPLLFHVPL